MSDKARILECLEFIANNPNGFSPEWAAEVEREGRALGLLKPLAGRRSIDPRCAALHDAIMARQESSGMFD